MKSKVVFAVLSASLLPIWAQVTVFNQTPTRAFGQSTLDAASSSPNLVEGRELFDPSGLAADTTVTPPILYVADRGNNRVLAWRNASGFTKGDRADLAIGQQDLTSTRPGGPRVGFSTGLSNPVAVAVDSDGNLFVADAGNNRILRYRKPFSSAGDFPTPDMVIGQRSISSGDQPNEGSTVPSAKTISLGSGSTVGRTSLVFDKQGNLWFADSLNNRVLRYPAAAIASGQSEPSADVVLGQTSLDTGTIQGQNFRTRKDILVQPSGIAIADSGDVYVSDALGRVLYYKAPVFSSAQATRILGVVIPTVGDPNPRTQGGCPPAPPYPCDSTLGAATNAGGINPPEGIATLGNNLFVADSGNNRIVKYDTPDRWPAECTPAPDNTLPTCAGGSAFSPPALLFIGQSGGQSIKANRDLREAGANSLSNPVALLFVGTDLYVADSGNNRVLVFPAGGGLYPVATRVLGQVDFNFSAPNLIEGRELFIYAGVTGGSFVVGGANMVVDRSSDPPHLYVSDSLNNRVLGFRDVRRVKAGDRADLVIGQPDLLHAVPNFATNDPNAPTDSTLFNPVGMLVDASGSLYVADAGNARVVRFPRPFDQAGQVKANLVIGQAGFFSKLTDATSRTMAVPYGLAFTQAGHLLVSDSQLNRVLLFKKPAGGDFTNGLPASAVFGQPNFTSRVSSSDKNRFFSPRGIATDSSDRLYVCDTGNNRVAVYTGVLNGEVDPPARFTPAISAPHGIAVNSAGEVWITDFTGNRIVRYPIYETWALNPQQPPISQIPAVLPFAVALDGNDNPIVAEALNRISFFYVQGTFRNAASYVVRGLAPGELVLLYRFGPPFANGTAFATSTPWPTTLGDTQVLFNGVPVPVFQELPDRVAFQVPGDAPTSGTADVQIVRTSTNEVLATATFTLQSADPALFTTNQQGTGQLAAINDEDKQANSPANRVSRGKIISLFGTGLGRVAGQPPDGQGASGPTPAPELPKVALSPGPAGFLPDSNIQYFGLAPGLPGLFQLNLLIPDSVPPSPAVSLALFYKDFASNDGPTVSGKIVTTIAVK